MIDAGRIATLLDVKAPGPGIVSVYLTVPLDPGQRRGMPARLDDLLAQAEHPSVDGASWARAQRCEFPAIRQAVTAHAHQWLGHSVAVFGSTGLGLLETIPLRGQVTERAVIASRPYVRPLLAELQRSPKYVAAVVDRRHAWLFRISADGTDPLAHVEGQTVARRFAGWHGLSAYRNTQRSRNLAHQHYAATVSALAQATNGNGHVPIAVGGHEAAASEFLAELPAALRERVAGTFVIDPHTMSPARVRQLADEVVARWEDSRERRLAAEVCEQTPPRLAAVGLDACVSAANEHAIAVLVIPDDTVRPGFSCAGCGALAVKPGACPVCGGATEAVPDVIEALAVKVTTDGGSVEPIRAGEVLKDVAARRRFPDTTDHAYSRH